MGHIHTCFVLSFQGKDLRQDADDMCMICFSEALCCAPVINLSCGHMFHHQCTVDALSRKWPGPRITFNFAMCPICKAPVDHPLLKEELQPVWELQEDVKRKALMRLEYEGLHSKLSQDERASHAMERYAYYVCFKCKKSRTHHGWNRPARFGPTISETIRSARSEASVRRGAEFYGFVGNRKASEFPRENLPAELLRGK